MIGVVLWSDPLEGKAVIWCEDHGELAFFRTDSRRGLSYPELDAGDLVSFDVEVKQRLRYAYNPEVIEGAKYDSLPGSLKTQSADPSTGQTSRPSAEIVPLFPPVPCARTVRKKLAAFPV